VSGAVTARKRLVVARSGSLTGDVRVARLVIQDGASFSGNVSMGPQSEAAPKPPKPSEPAEAPEFEAVPSSDGKDRPASGKGRPKPKR
jgi:cytoskeletal protein CcmA (bactofilin family)